MATLLFKSHGQAPKPIELRMGINRIGRHENNDFAIEHPTVSSSHCEIVLEANAVILRDRDSTNGTFVNGERITEAVLRAGQTVHLGEVEFFVESTDITVAIPEIRRPSPVRKATLPESVPGCLNHIDTPATYRCTACEKTFCVVCVHMLRRRGGRPWRFCPACGSQCVRLDDRRKRKSIFARLRDTLKLPFRRTEESSSVQE